MTAPKDVKYPRAKTVTISVTKQIIDAAIPRKSNSCMIADAIKEQIPTVKWPAVDMATIRFTLGNFRYTYTTPNIVRNSIIAFDHGDKIKEFSFKLFGAGSQVTQAGKEAEKIGKKPVLKAEHWEPVKAALKETIKKTPVADIAEGVGVSERTIKEYVKPKGNIPTVTLASKLLHLAQEEYPDTPLSDIAEDAITEINDAQTPEEREALLKSELRRMKLTKESDRSIPQVNGGSLPKRHPNASIHRAYGARVMKP